jgi:hypothetical protein
MSMILMGVSKIYEFIDYNPNLEKSQYVPNKTEIQIHNHINYLTMSFGFFFGLVVTLKMYVICRYHYGKKAMKKRTVASIYI